MSGALTDRSPHSQQQGVLGSSSSSSSSSETVGGSRDGPLHVLAEHLKSPLGGSSSAKTKFPPAETMVCFGCVEAKYLVCGLLVAQNTGAVLLMRYTRSMPGEGDFVTQTAVIAQECLKGAACVLLLLKDHGTIASAWEKPREALKTSVPAFLYLIQNNLQYVAVTYLDAATYTVSYQTKIVWSGVLSVILLNRRLSLHKWLGVALLTVGVATVQIAGHLASSRETGFSGSAEGATSSTSSSSVTEDAATTTLASGTATAVASSASWASSARAVGFVCVVCAAIVSALAGVYFEKILKGAKVGLWTRNLQLAAYSVVIGYCKLATSDEGRRMRAGGAPFFYGYTRLTWLCVLINAFGGLLVGTVIRYADAVAKDVALGCSIVLSSLVSTVLFDLRLDGLFVFGIALVVYAVFLYGERAHCCGLVGNKAVLQASTTATKATPLPKTSRDDDDDLAADSPSAKSGKIVPTNNNNSAGGAGGSSSSKASHVLPLTAADVSSSLK